MQTVSRGWRLRQKEYDIGNSFIEVSINLTDPDALEDASASDNNSSFFSNTEQIVDGLDKRLSPYAFLEQNQWVLDGSKPFLFDWEDMGYVSNVLCNFDSVFSPIPVITISFSRIFEDLIPGITITWSKTYGEFATDFTVNAYNGSELIARKIVTGNREIVSDVEVDIINYNRIEIEIYKWCLPFRRARVEEVLTGIGRTYRNRDVFAFSQEMIADPLAISLPKYSITYDLNNIDNAFDPNNIQGFAKYLIERQKVDVRYGYKINDEIEWISGGVHYLSEWTSPQNGIRATFTARDILEFTRGVFNRGLHRPGGISLYDLAVQVLTEIDLPLNPDGHENWYIHDMMKDVFTTAPLPQVPLKTCLQYIANAGCCCISFDRTGRLRIDPASITAFLGHSEITSNNAADFSKPEQIIESDINYKPYATGELNQWVLNESFEIDLGDTGFVSKELCDADGVFANPPTVVMNFAKVHTALIPEINITWSEAFNEYATDFRVIVYGENIVGDSVLINQKSVADNTNITSIVDIDIQNYNRIEIEVLKWCLPYRRARIEEIPSKLDYEINHFNSWLKPEITVTLPLGGVEVSVFNHVVSQHGIAELFKGTRRIIGTQTITLNYSSATNVIATLSTNATLISANYYTYSCELTITANGNVDITINGIPLETSESVLSLSTGQKGETHQIMNPLITSTEQAQKVGEWEMNYLISRQTATYNWRADPRLDALDAVLVQNNYGFRASRMSEVRYEYNGMFKGTGKGRVIIE